MPRVDDRENVIPNASPTLSENGRRTDVAVTVGYQPSPGKVLPVGGALPGTPMGPDKSANAGAAAAGHSFAEPRPWDVYGFVQDTTLHTETMPDNDTSIRELPWPDI